MMSTDQAKLRIIEIGRDERDLGRWVWMRYRKRNKITMRVISVHICGSNLGPTTVYSQQQSYFNKIGNDRYPRDIMREELLECIKSWLNLGDSIILIIDANEDVMNRAQVVELATLGIVEAIIDRHQTLQDLQPIHNRG